MPGSGIRRGVPARLFSFFLGGLFEPIDADRSRMDSGAGGELASRVLYVILPDRRDAGGKMAAVFRPHSRHSEAQDLAAALNGGSAALRLRWVSRQSPAAVLVLAGSPRKRSLAQDC